MERILLLLLLVGLVVAKPSFDGDDDELIQNLVNQKDVEDVQYQPEANLNLNDEDSDQDLSIFFKFIHYLIHVSIGKVKPDEHPDIKYIKPGKELVKRLLVVREAVIGTFEPFIEIGKLLVQDHNEMMKRLYKAVKEQNMFKSKHIAGEYFVALNRRFVLLLIHADRMGLFRGIGKNRSEDAVHLHRIKRELEDQVNKAQKAINFILENFDDLRISDGLLDEPFVKLGVQTVKVFTKAFKQAIKVGRANVMYYTDMITDIVRLALVEKKHEAAIQRAGAGVLSGMRRDSKTVLEIQRWYARQKCFGPEEDEAELKESSKIEEKPNDA